MKGPNYKTCSLETEIFLPQTEEAFDILVDRLVKSFQLKDTEHAAAVVANRIQHMPPDQAKTTLNHLGQCVLKNNAYMVAVHKSAKIRHKSQLDDLEATLTSEPTNQQALDAITKASNEGSEYAQAILKKIESQYIQE